jgi:glycerophosphoryl diester phosphodiesterase
VGVDTLELDLQITKDGQLVVSHDAFVSPKLCRYDDGRTLAAPLLIHSLTLAQLRKFDCGSIRHERFAKQITVPHTPIPTLDEVFSLVKSSALPRAKTVGFNIETKIVPRYSDRSASPEQFARMLLATAKQYDMLSRITVQSFDHRSLRAIKQQNPSVAISLLLSEDMPDWAALIKAEHAEIVSPDMDWVTPESVAAAHAAGARVIPYTANNEADWNYLLSCGVDGLISDDPAALIAYLHTRVPVQFAASKN